MRNKLTGPIVATMVSGLLLASPAISAGAAGSAWSPIGDWRFNELAHARTGADSSGSGLDATIGVNVNTGLTSGTRTYINFPSSGSGGPPNTERLVLVDDDDALDPGNRIYRVAIAFRTRAAGVNVVQKGQANVTGGYWKIETHNGLATCLFRDKNNQSSGVGSGKRVDDGQWHKVVCIRYPDHTVMIVDGVVTATNYNPSGTLSNIWPVSIGGKSSCGGSVGCDYFIGDIDFVRISTQ